MNEMTSEALLAAIIQRGYSTSQGTGWRAKDLLVHSTFCSIDARKALFDQDRLATFAFTKVDDIGDHFSLVHDRGQYLKEMLRGKQSNCAFATRDISTFRLDRNLTLLTLDTRKGAKH
jgi:hypothetical protein